MSLRVHVLSVAIQAAVFVPSVGLGQTTADEEEREVRTVARVIATSGVAGNLARPACSEDPPIGDTPFAHLTPRLVAHAEQPSPPFLLDTGGLLHPGGFARFAVRHQPSRLAGLLDRLGYRLLVFGPSELGAPRNSQIEVYRELRARGVPVVATNLFCERADDPLCRVLVDGADGIPLFDVGQRRIGVIAVMPPDTLGRVAAERAHGLHLAPMAESLATSVRRARRSGANFVIGIVHTDKVADAVSLVNELPAGDRPDVAISADGGDELLFARPSGFHPPIVAAPSQGAVVARIRESLDLGVYDILTRPMVPSRWTAEAYEAWAADTGRAYCEQWGHELPGGGVESPVTGQDMLELAASVMRQASDAEVAILNQGALDRRWRPMKSDALVASDVYLAFPYDEVLVSAEVEPEWLQSVASVEGLVTLGLDGDMVNGRPVEPRGTYRVVTLQYLASGGDGVLPPGPSWQRVRDLRLRESLLSHLQVSRSVDPRTAFPDPMDDFAWVLRWDINGTFSGVVVDNPTVDGSVAYSATQLTRASNLTVGLDTTIRADALSRVWRWDNEFRAITLRTRTVGSGFTDDPGVLALRSTVTYRGLQQRWERFYVPEPFIETFIESEITVPEERNFRHLELRPTAGLRFSLADELSLKLGASVRTELLDPNRELTPGGQAELRLAPWVIAEAEDRSLTLEGFITFFASGSLQELRGQVDSGFDILRPLALLFRFGVFAQADGDRPAGVAFDTTIALRLRFVGRIAP